VARTKAADEVFCTACGAAIKREAELCPECGVRNDAGSGGGSSGATGTGSPPTRSGHDPSRYHTDVSENWWYGVAIGTALWALIFAATGVLDALGATGGVLVLVAWIGLPLSAYFDAQYVRGNGPWAPETAFWVIGLAVWFLNVPLGVVYLYRRHEALGVP
jgi:hypothetical protein